MAGTWREKFEALLQPKLPLALRTRNAAEVLDSLFRMNHRSEFENNNLFQPLFKLIELLLCDAGERTLNQPGCCRFHANCLKVIREFITQKNGSDEDSQARIFAYIFNLAGVYLDRFDLHQEIYSSTADHPELSNYDSGLVSVSRFIPLHIFIENYLRPRPSSQSVYKADTLTLSSFGHKLAIAMDQRRSRSDRIKLLSNCKYGAPRGWLGAYMDKDISPTFNYHCKHASAYCVLQGSIDQIKAYRFDHDIVELLATLGVPSEQIRGHYVEAIYSVPLFNSKNRTGLRSPGFLDAGGYPQWRPKGRTLSLEGSAAPGSGRDEFVHSPICIERNEIDFVFWPNSEFGSKSDIIPWHMS